MKKSRGLSLVLAAALTITSVVGSPVSSEAAKKPKLNKKSLKMNVGSTYTLKLKNGNKKAKVAWKTSAKAKVALSKKTNKSVKLTAKKAGKATITATYKLGKKKPTKLTCTVTVKANSATEAPIITDVPVVINPPVVVTDPPVVVTDPPVVSNNPTKTPRVTKTPGPTATPKPTAAPVDGIDVTTDVFDVLKYTVMDVGDDAIVATANADGSYTVDFTGVDGYKGVRWYFGKYSDEVDEKGKKKVNITPLNLSNYTYCVIEGENQAGVKGNHDLNTQFLDASDKAEHGGLLEINTTSGFSFPLKFDFDGVRTDVAGYEIYIPNKKDSNKTGPITIKSVMLYKSKEVYEKLHASDTPAPPTATPVPYYGDYVVDLSDPNAFELEQCNRENVKYNKDTGYLEASFGDYQGITMMLPDGAGNIYDKITMVYKLSGTKLKAYVYDGDFNGKYGQNDPGAHEIALEESATDKEVVFAVQDNYAGKRIKAIKFFNWDGSPATFNIKSLVFSEAPGQPTAPPAKVELPVDLTKPTKMGEDGSVTYADGAIKGTGISKFTVPITKPIKKGMKYDVTISGTSTGALRAWFSDRDGWTKKSDFYDPVVFDEPGVITADADDATPCIQIGVPYGGTPCDCTITKIVITENESSTPDETPTPGGDSTPTPDETPTPPSAKMLDVYRAAAPITVDGNIDAAWGDVDYFDFANYGTTTKTVGTTMARAKVMWDDNNLYGLVEVADPDFTSAAGSDYERDGIEFYLDEDNSGENSYNDNTDAFQYRYTGDGNKLCNEIKSGDGNKTKYAGIQVAKTIKAGSHYVVEFKIPWAGKVAAGKELGFDINVNDSTGSGRNREIRLMADQDKGNAALYMDPSLMGKIKLVQNGTELDVTNATAGGKKGTVKDGSVTFENVNLILLPLGDYAMSAGETYNVTVFGSCEGAAPRMWLSKGEWDCRSNQIGSSGAPAMVFGNRYKLTVNAGDAPDSIQIKVQSGNFSKITFDKVLVEKVEAPAAENYTDIALSPEVKTLDLSKRKMEYGGDSDKAGINAEYVAGEGLKLVVPDHNFVGYSFTPAFTGGGTIEVVYDYDGNGAKPGFYLDPYDNDLKVDFEAGTNKVWNQHFDNGLNYLKVFCVNESNWRMGNGKSSSFTVKSIKYTSDDVKGYVVPADAKTLKATYKRGNETCTSTVSLDVLDSYVDEYNDIYTAVSSLAGKAAGYQLVKYHGNDTIAFDKVSADKAIVTIAKPSGLSTFVMTFSGDDAEKTVVVKEANTYTLKVKAASKNVAKITRDGVGEYTVETSKTDADNYSVSVTTPAGSVTKLTKSADGYFVITDANTVNGRSFKLAYK